MKSTILSYITQIVFGSLLVTIDCGNHGGHNRGPGRDNGKHITGDFQGEGAYYDIKRGGQNVNKRYDNHYQSNNHQNNNHQNNNHQLNNHQNNNHGNYQNVNTHHGKGEMQQYDDDSNLDDVEADMESLSAKMDNDEFESLGESLPKEEPIMNNKGPSNMRGNNPNNKLMNMMPQNDNKQKINENKMNNQDNIQRPRKQEQIKNENIEQKVSNKPMGAVGSKKDIITEQTKAGVEKVEKKPKLGLYEKPIATPLPHNSQQKVVTPVIMAAQPVIPAQNNTQTALPMQTMPAGQKINEVYPIDRNIMNNNRNENGQNENNDLDGIEQDPRMQVLLLKGKVSAKKLHVVIAALVAVIGTTLVNLMVFLPIMFCRKKAEDKSAIN